MKKLRFVTVPALCLALLSTAGISHASPSDLDTTFAGTGQRRAGVGENDAVNAVIAQSNRILAAGTSKSGTSLTQSDFVVLRTLITNGANDTTFGTNGIVTIDFGGTTRSIDECNAMAVQSDGKIVLVGNTDSNLTAGDDWAVVRLNTNGTLDTTFSGDGKATIDMGNAGEAATGVAVQSDGSIVIGGYTNNNPTSGSEHDFAAARLTSAGVLDTSFSGDGKVTVDFGYQDQASALGLQSDGKIVLAGYTANTTQGNNFAIARLTSAGALDTTFSGNGKEAIDFGGSEYATSLALQSDGKIVVAGSKDYASIASTTALARLTTAGVLDTTFGTGGKVTDDWGSDYDIIGGIALQGSKIVAVGSLVSVNGNYVSAVARYNSTGTDDTTFSSSGRVNTTWPNDGGYNSVAIQGDGKIVAAGFAGWGTTSDFAIGRYLGSYVPAPALATSGGSS